MSVNPSYSAQAPVREINPAIAQGAEKYQASAPNLDLLTDRQVVEAIATEGKACARLEQRRHDVGEKLYKSEGSEVEFWARYTAHMALHNEVYRRAGKYGIPEDLSELTLGELSKRRYVIAQVLNGWLHLTNMTMLQGLQMLKDDCDRIKAEVKKRGLKMQTPYTARWRFHGPDGDRYVIADFWASKPGHTSAGAPTSSERFENDQRAIEAYIAKFGERPTGKPQLLGTDPKPHFSKVTA